METSQNPNTNQTEDTAKLTTNEEILQLLKEQNKLLSEIQLRLFASIDKDDEGNYRVRNKVEDFNMSMGSMVGFMFKWLIASIPVAIVVFLAYLFIGIPLN